MMRVRLKADGRIVEILADGSEQAIVLDAHPPKPRPVTDAPALAPAETVLATNGAAAPRTDDAAYAKGVRARTRLTQAQFAARIGVPIETVRNWEQGKRSPRGPARALLKLIDRAPDAAFAALNPAKSDH
jgi:putative transcriptional regulator